MGGKRKPRDIPKWVRDLQGPNVEVHVRGVNYYAYRIENVRVPGQEHSKKVTAEYLGKFTRDGIRPRRPRRPAGEGGGALEAGNISFLDPFVAAVQPAVKTAFPNDWQNLVAAAVLKLCYLEPCSRLKVRYETSLAKHRWPEAHLSDDALPGLLRRVGFQWAAQRDVFRALAKDEKHMAIDLSHVFSDSQGMPMLEYGHNGDDVWRPQLQVLLCWGTTTHRPGYLQLLLGATQSAQTLAHVIREVPLQEVVAILDKGFWSPENVKAFEAEDVHYAMALKRDLPIVDLRPHTEYRDHFLYRSHAQWWRRDEVDGRIIYHFLDKKIADEQESTWLQRIQEAETPKETRKLQEAYEAARDGLGTLSVITDTGLPAAEVYALYRERRDVEYAFDSLQNDLRGDVTWMRSRESMVGYHFILFLALHLYSQVLDHLKRKKLLSTYSVRDVLVYLSKVMVLEEEGATYPLPVTRQTQVVLDKLEVPKAPSAGPPTQTSGL